MLTRLTKQENQISLGSMIIYGYSLQSTETLAKRENKDEWDVVAMHTIGND